MQNYEELYNQLLQNYVREGYSEDRFFEEFPLAHVKLLEFLYQYPDKDEINESIEYGCLEELIPVDILVSIQNLEEKYRLYLKIREESKPQQDANVVDNSTVSVDEGSLDFEEGSLDFEEGSLDFEEEPTLPTESVVEVKTDIVQPQPQQSQQPQSQQSQPQSQQQPQVEAKIEVEEPALHHTPAVQPNLVNVDEKIKPFLVDIANKLPGTEEGKKRVIASGIVYCTSCTFHKANGGNYYLRLMFKDIYGRDIEAKQFRFSGTKEDCVNFISKVCQISGYWDNYRGTDQIIVDRMAVIKDATLQTYGITEDVFVGSVSSNVDLKSYAETVLGFIQSIEDVDYKKLLNHIFVNHDYIRKYLEVPAGIVYHHTGKGHLLQHVAEVAQCCVGLSSVMPYLPINMSLCITGALLHDIGKVVEMPTNGTLSYTHEGIQCGHIVIGTSLVTTFANETQLPHTKLMNLLSIIATHHGSTDKGSPVNANSPDAMLVHMADECSAQLNHMYLVTQDIQPNVGISSDRGQNYIRLS